MTKTVTCIKLKAELPGLEFMPYPGELGQKIFDQVSQQAWRAWLSHQTMLINENRLSPINPDHRKFLEKEMDNYFFGSGSSLPEGFVPQEK